MEKRIHYSNILLGFKKDRAFEWTTSTFPVTVVKIKNTPDLDRELFKAVVTNASEERMFFGDRLFCKCQRQRFLSPPSEAAVTGCSQEPDTGILWITGLGFHLFQFKQEEVSMNYTEVSSP